VFAQLNVLRPIDNGLRDTVPFKYRELAVRLPEQRFPPNTQLDMVEARCRISVWNGAEVVDEIPIKGVDCRLSLVGAYCTPKHHGDRRRSRELATNKVINRLRLHRIYKFKSSHMP
jgi:hypothetical protein